MSPLWLDSALKCIAYCFQALEVLRFRRTGTVLKTSQGLTAKISFCSSLQPSWTATSNIRTTRWVSLNLGLHRIMNLSVSQYHIRVTTNCLGDSLHRANFLASLGESVANRSCHLTSSVLLNSWQDFAMFWSMIPSRNSYQHLLTTCQLRTIDERAPCLQSMVSRSTSSLNGSWRFILNFFTPIASRRMPSMTATMATLHSTEVHSHIGSTTVANKRILYLFIHHQFLVSLRGRCMRRILTS